MMKKTIALSAAAMALSSVLTVAAVFAQSPSPYEPQQTVPPTTSPMVTPQAPATGLGGLSK